jgi:hypothetical protein
MFGRQNVYATLSRFAGIRVKDEREKDRNHVVEVEWEAPLTFDLADEISPALARDLYDLEAGELVPKREISEVAPILAVGRQVMTVRPHPDLEPLGKLAGVELRKIWITKSEAGTWLISFLTMFPFEERTVIGLIKHLKLGVYLTFQAEAPALDFDGKTAAAGPDPDGDMGIHTNNVTDFADARRRAVQDMDAGQTNPAADAGIVTGKRGRGRPKGSKNRRNPEQTKADQIADARARAADEAGA